MGISHWLKRALGEGDVTAFESRYATHAPAAQATVDIFSEGWASRLPLEEVRSGSSDLFNDPTLRWLLQEASAVSGARVLELGPLEGAHSHTLQRAGARQVVAVESNARSYLKCLMVKELLGMDRCRFLFGDFREFLRATQERFDVALASGVLYHLVAPYDLFPLLAARCDGPVLLWTHYWDQRIEGESPQLHRRFRSKRAVVLPNGVEVECHRHEYGSQPRRSRFWGGNRPYSEWMSRADIVASAEAAGYRVQSMMDVEHIGGPSVAMVLRPAAT